METIKIFYRTILFFGLFIFILSHSANSQETVPEPDKGVLEDSLAQASSAQPQPTILPSEIKEFTDLKSNEVDTPLPYQIDFDIAAFMSCPGDAAPNDSVFLKFGAYTSGLQFNPDFFDESLISAIRKKIESKQNTEVHQAVTKEEVRKKLESSSLINAEAQLSLNETGYPGRIALIGDNNTAVVETLTLNHPSVIQNLVQDGVSYWLGHNASVELQLPYPKNGLLNLLDDLNTKFTIYLTYNGGQDLRPLKRAESYYYGRYFNFNFNSKKSYLTGMKEYDLQDDQSLGKWVCPPDLRFAVHRDPAHTQAVYKVNRETFFDPNNISAEWECQEDSEDNPNDWKKKLLSVLMKNHSFTYGKTVKIERDLNGINRPVQSNKICIRPMDSIYPVNIISPRCYNTQNTVKVDFEESHCTFMEDKGIVCPAYLSVCINLAQAGPGN